MDTDTKPKMISELDLSLPAPIVTSREWLRESVDEHLNCVLCGTALEFKHRTDFITLSVVEDAHCPGCRVRSRQSAHTLQ